MTGERLPPGEYQAQAGRTDSPFQMVLDYQESRQEFVVAPGQREHRIELRLETR